MVRVQVDGEVNGREECVGYRGKMEGIVANPICGKGGETQWKDGLYDPHKIFHHLAAEIAQSIQGALWAGLWKIGVQFLAGGRDFSLLSSI